MRGEVRLCGLAMDLALMWRGLQKGCMKRAIVLIVVVALAYRTKSTTCGCFSQR